MAETQTQQQNFLNTREVCARLGVTRQTVFNLVARGALHKHTSELGRGRGGTRVYFDAQEVATLAHGLPQIGEQVKDARPVAPVRKTRKPKRVGKGSK